MRRRRIEPPGIEIWRLGEHVETGLERFGEDGFLKMFAREDRADIYKVAGAVYLIKRRGEVATVACIASLLDWPFPRVRTALCALGERGAVQRVRIPNPSGRRVGLDWNRQHPGEAAHFEPAGNESDPRLDSVEIIEREEESFEARRKSE